MDTFFCELGSDKYIRENFFSDYQYKGTMVEVGGGHPELYSTSKHWIDNGWRAIIFEPQPKFFEMHKNLNNEVYDVAISNACGEDIDFHICKDSMGMSASALEHRIGQYNLDQIIKTNTITLDKALDVIDVNKIDIVNIDVEGWELEVMQGFSPEKYNFPLIVLENFTRSSSYIEYMEKIGYKLIWNLEYNYLFQHE